MHNEVVVHAEQLQVFRASWIAFKRIDGKGAVAGLHEVLRAVVDSSPKHLQAAIHHGGVAGPIEPGLVNLALANLRFGLLAIGVAQMCAAMVIAFGSGILALHPVGQPHKVGVFRSGQSVFSRCLHHQAVAGKVARTADSARRICGTAIEAVVEAPKYVSTGQQCCLHTVPAIPPQRAREEGVVAFVLIDVHIGVSVIVRHTLQTPFGLELWLGPFLPAILRHCLHEAENAEDYQQAVSHCPYFTFSWIVVTVSRHGRHPRLVRSKRGGWSSRLTDSPKKDRQAEDPREGRPPCRDRGCRC